MHKNNTPPTGKRTNVVLNSHIFTEWNKFSKGRMFSSSKLTETMQEGPLFLFTSAVLVPPLLHPKLYIASASCPAGNSIHTRWGDVEGSWSRRWPETPPALTKTRFIQFHGSNQVRWAVSTAHGNLGRAHAGWSAPPVLSRPTPTHMDDLGSLILFMNLWFHSINLGSNLQGYLNRSYTNYHAPFR